MCPAPRHRHLWRSCPRVSLSCGRAEGSHHCSPARVRSRDPRRPTGQREHIRAGWAAMWAARAAGRAPPTPGDLHGRSERGQLPLPGRMGSVAASVHSLLATTLLGPCCSKWSHGQHMSFVYPVLGEHLATTPRGQSCYYPHFTATENETRRS